MRTLFDLLARLARTSLSVLVEGETGTGKELAARALHAASPQAQGPFVVLDCTAIPATLAESVLFGHEKGAFTGARDARPGFFEAADGGTVFLDEVGELSAELQPKLLRVLERREVVRVGATRARAVAFRVVAATWRDLRALVNQGRFREDLYHRLAQARVAIPPLRQRPDDVPLLVERFLAAREKGTEGARAIAPDALADLVRRPFPGNVRELRNLVDRVAGLAAGPVITPADLAFERMLLGDGDRAPASVTPAGRTSVLPPAGDELMPFKDAKRTVIDEFERAYLEQLLARNGSIIKLAAVARVERHYLGALLRKHGLRGDDE
jgi:DNA-binding NtrC family response regulator